MTFSTRSSKGADVSKSDALDIAGMCLLGLFAFAVWPPLILLVFGIGALAASWKAPS